MASAETPPDVKPTVGRIVHFVGAPLYGADGRLVFPQDPRHVAAIVTEVLEGGRVHLRTFDPPGYIAVMMTRDGVPYCEHYGPHTWHWPERN